MFLRTCGRVIFRNNGFVFNRSWNRMEMGFRKCYYSTDPSNLEYEPNVTDILGTFIRPEIEPIADSNLSNRNEFQKNHYVRLDKLLSNLGIVTRRKSVDFIKRNNITVAIGEDEYQEYDHTLGEVVTKRKEVLKRVSYSTIVYPPAVRHEGHPLEYINKLTIVMHKPRGYVCSHTRDDPESKIVFDLLPKQILSLKPKLSVAGRLDKWASGLLILSQDGQLISKIIQQNIHRKQYLVELKHDAKGTEPELFESGTLKLRNEKKACLPAEMTLVDPRTARIVLQEGKYHQIRRMIAATGNMSLGVHREMIGDIGLDELQPGSWRDITTQELEHLWTGKPLHLCSEEFVLNAPKQKKKKHIRKRFPREKKELPTKK